MMSRAALFAASLVVLFGCSSAEPPSRAAEMCLANKDDVLKLIHEVKEVANEEKMEFIDGSKQTARGLDVIGYKDPGRKDGSSLIHVSVRRADGMGLIATNAGLPGYQLALGFSQGQPDATRFADKVLDRLGQYWHVEELPAGSSVKPDPECAQHLSVPK